MAGRIKFDAERRTRFLEALALDSNLGRAAVSVGVDIDTTYKARLRDPAFAAEVEAALMRGAERELQRRQDRALDAQRAAEADGTADADASGARRDSWLAGRLAKLAALQPARTAPARRTRAELEAEVLERLAVLGGHRKTKAK